MSGLIFSVQLQQRMEWNDEDDVGDEEEDVVDFYLEYDEEASLYYVVVYCLRSLCRTSQLRCDPYFEDVQADSPPSDIGKLSLLIEYTRATGNGLSLSYASWEVYEAYRKAEDVVRTYDNRIVDLCDVIATLLQRTLRCIECDLSPCYDYIPVIVKKLLSIRVKVLCKHLTKTCTRRSIALASKILAMRSIVSNINRK